MDSTVGADTQTDEELLDAAHNGEGQELSGKNWWPEGLGPVLLVESEP
jgi:hypothetical protein